MKAALSILLCIALSGMSFFALAEEATTDDTNIEDTRYINMKSLVANYGGTGKLKFLRTEISLRVSSKEIQQLVQYHLPALRHVIIMLMSKQTDEAFASVESKNELRLQALAEAKKVMQEEEGQEYIDDLLFSSFFIQR